MTAAPGTPKRCITPVTSRPIFWTTAARKSARAFAAAVADRSPRFEGEQRNAIVRFFVLCADKKKMARLNKLLNELENAAAHSCDVGDEIQLTLLLSALPSKG